MRRWGCPARSERVVAKFFFEGLADGMIVFVRNGGEGDAAEFPDEPYWLGVVAHETEDHALAWKAKAGEQVDGGHLCTVGQWLIRFRWLWYEPDAPESAGAALTSPKYGRARAYRAGTLAEGTVIYPGTCIVTSRFHEMAGKLKVVFDNGYWWVPAPIHHHVTVTFAGDLVPDEAD